MTSEAMISEVVLADPKRWNALLLERVTELEVLNHDLSLLPNSDLKRARQLEVAALLSTGEAVSLEAGMPPLLVAATFAVWVSGFHYTQTFEHAHLIPVATDALSTEARVKCLLAVAEAAWGLHQYPRGVKYARDALELAQSQSWQGLAETAALLSEDCQMQGGHASLAAYEAHLRAANTLEARGKLAMLHSRRGLYDAALKVSTDAVARRLGGEFRAAMLVAARRDFEVDWAALGNSPELGWMRAVAAMNHFDARAVLAGPAPDSGIPLGRRTRAAWHLAFAWANLETGKLARALHHLRGPLVYRAEWDLRFIRTLGLLELVALEPDWFRAEFDGAHRLLPEALALMRTRLSPEAQVFELLPRYYPHAALMLVLSGEAITELEASTRRHVATVSARGFTVNGVTRTAAGAMLRVLNGETEGMSATALSSARHRLKRLLKRHGNPRVVLEARVLAAMEVVSRV